MIFPAWKKHEMLISGVVSILFLLVSIFLIRAYTNTLKVLTEPAPKAYAQNTQVQGVSDHPTPQPSFFPSPTIHPSRIPTSKPTEPPAPTPTTYTSPAPETVVHPSPILTAESKPRSESNNSDILSALNTYRQRNGIGPLIIDSTLQQFAQSRAEQFALNGSMDNHAGFQSMLSDNGFEKTGFNALGENSSFGAWGTSQNLIESIYGSSSAHNESQLRSDWSHVGIGVKDTATNLVFGGKKR